MDLGAHWPLLSLRNMLVLVLTVFVLVSGHELTTTAAVSDGANTTATESTTIMPSSTSEASSPSSSSTSLSTSSSTEATSTTVTTSVTIVATSDTTTSSLVITTASTTDITNTSTTFSNMTERTGSGRAINLDEQMSTSPEKGSLQDLSLDDIEEPSSNMTTSSPAPSTTDSPSSTTTEGVTNATISLNGTKCVEPGLEVNTGCNEKCECGSDGHLMCEPRCPVPQLQRSVAVRTLDPACTLRPVEDPCCALLVCTQADTETEPLEGCVYKNETHQRGDTFMDGCGTVCTCGEAGHVTCKSRCPPVTNNSTSDRCVALPDPTDPCCTVVLCDVTLGDHDVSKQGVEEPNPPKHVQVLTAELVNQTAVRLVLEPQQDNVTVESSLDQVTWQRQESDDLLVTGLKPGTTYYLRAKVGSLVSNAVQVALPDKETDSKLSGCMYKGKQYAMGDEFHDGCEAFCACTETGVQCATIECPTDFGLDVLDPTCVSWEMHPADFTPTPPNCCPDHVRCRDNGSCIYEGEQYPNWAEIPMKITGCDKRCYCEFGNITCQSTCPPVDKEPPTNLACPPSVAILNHLPGDDCCLYWMCPQQQLHTGFAVPPPHPGFGPQHSVGRQDEITVQTLEAIDDSTVRLVFSVPPVLVGLHGRVELRYTADKQNMDPSTWLQQVFAPPGDLIATPQLEFELGDLQPDTVYNIKVTLNLRDLHNSPSSPTLSVRTLPRAVPVTTLPPQIPIDVALMLDEVNSTWAKLIWRKFSEFELQFIDGVQLRYKEKEGKVYLATPLIHRAVTSYTIEGLRPLTHYEVGIFFIPFPGQTTELMSEHVVQLITGDVADPYKFNITLEVSHIKSTSVELSWSGVPYPEDKYVNVYRAIYQSDAGKEDFSSFKIAKRDAPSRTMIQDLKPGTRYRLWLEVYLTNGRIKKSNVQDFITKPGAVPAVGATQQGQLKAGSHIEPLVETSDYYGPLVAVAIIAALAILAALILLLILMRKHGTNKAAISASRKTQSAYDNPSYKTSENNGEQMTNGGPVPKPGEQQMQQPA